ncbi:MAG TPA: CBS domain-containing protein [Chitinophagaceae bacterium]|nr:CBS domain-containing protein [Chitinophagaceae bacterium]
MNTVSSILARKGLSVLSVSPDTPVIEALRIMSDNNVGSVVVMQDGKYTGIMTERDYSRKVALRGKSSADIQVGEIMSTDLPAVKPTDTVEHCMQLMSNKNIRYMPVFDGEKLLGIISISDVVKETILAQKETIEQLHSFIQGNI